MYKDSKRSIPEYLKDIEKTIQDLTCVLKGALNEEPALMSTCSKCGYIIPIEQQAFKFKGGDLVYSNATQRYGLVLEVKSKTELPFTGTITVLTRGRNTRVLIIEPWVILKDEKYIKLLPVDQHCHRTVYELLML